MAHSQTILGWFRMCKSRLAPGPKRLLQNSSKGKCTQTYAPPGAKGYLSLPLRTAAELLQVFRLFTSRGQCCIKAALCHHILSPLLFLSIQQIDSMSDIFFPPALLFNTHKRPPKQLNLRGELFLSKISSHEQKKKPTKKSGVARGPQGWPGCQSVLGHKRLRSQHCPFSACHMSTVTHSLCVWRIDSHLRMPPPPTPPGGVWQSEEKFGLIGELPHRSMSDQSAACVPFSTPSFRAVFWNILLSHIKHLIFSVLK